MKNKKLYLILVLLALTVAVYFLIKSSTRYESFKDSIEFKQNNYIVNTTEFKYLDTVIHVGLNMLDVKNQNVIVRFISDDIKNLFQIGEDITYNAFIVYNYPSHYHIFISEQSRYNHIEIIAHELIHLNQYHSKRLVLDTFDKKYVYFDGTIYDIIATDYFKRPWEIEAFKLQLPLIDSLINYLY